MKQLILTVTLAVAGFTAVAPASQGAEQRRRDEFQEHNERWTDFRQLRAQVYQLDLLFSRVDRQMRWSAGRQTSWEYSRLVRDRERLNYELQRRPFDRLRVISMIDRMQSELRELEVRLRVRSHGRYYR
jgi:hypothetical protein